MTAEFGHNGVVNGGPGPHKGIIGRQLEEKRE